MNIAEGRDPARQVAYDVVRAVDVDAAYANLLLPRLLRERRLSTRDAAFATEVAYGTLRWQGVLDVVLGAVSSRPLPAVDPEVRAVLRLGSYQLLHLRVPAHAAVHANVELARAVAGHRVAGFVNAVLRRVAAHDWSQWVARLAPVDDVGRRAFAAGYPDWVAAAFLDVLDGDLAELDAALAVDRPVTHLVARPGRITPEELLAQAGPQASAGLWSPYAVRLHGGDPATLEAIRDGRAAVQDEGSQLAALALIRVGLDGRDDRWLDMCAGPGGKAALLAGSMRAGGGLLATDLAPHRARLVAAALAGTTAGVAVADATRGPWRDGTFDRVLLDAPCTGLGALRRRPEVRWRRHPEDVGRLQRLQVTLLDAAVDATRPGGLIAYVTCSPHRAETRTVVDAVMSRRAGLSWVDARSVLTDVTGLGQGPDIRLWPHRHGTDAMYVALLRLAHGP